MGEERALNQTKGSGMLGRARAEESELPSLLFVWMTVVKQETLKQRSEGQEGVSGREDGGVFIWEEDWETGEQQWENKYPIEQSIHPS